MRKNIPYARQDVTSEDIKEVIAALKSDWLTSGPRVKYFEDAVADYLGVRHAIAVSNGTAALHVACLALGIKKGDVGVTSPLTFLASANCIAYCGGRPEFVDVDDNSLCLSPEKVESFIKVYGAPKVVIPVDFAGAPAQLAEFRVLADRHGFKLVEDAAHSLGTRYKEGRKWRYSASCHHTDMAALSFHPVKTITTGEGGMVLTNDASLARRARLFASHGVERDLSRFTPWPIDNAAGMIANTSARGKQGAGVAPWLYQQQFLGFNYRITDIQCALGLSQFKRLPEIAARRKEIVRYYNEAFCGLAGVRTPCLGADMDTVNHLYAVRITSGGKARHRMMEALTARGIRPQIHYIPVHLQPWYGKQKRNRVGVCPVAERAYDQLLSLPLFPAMSDSEVGRVVKAFSCAAKEVGL